MRTATRALIPPMTVVLFASIVITPLLQHRMTCSDDGAFGIHKALGLELAVHLGNWFPRWSPHMAHGFGYPLYNFYAPLASYLLAGIHKLGFIYPLALHIAFGFAILFAGLAVYALVKPWWGSRAGIAAGVVYLTSPYIAFNVLFRGALSETIALVLLPVILLTFDKALRYTETHWMALATLSFASLIYTHNTTALLATPMIVGYSFLLSWEKRSFYTLARATILVIAGLMLSAHFWIPALSERSLIQSDQLLTPPIFTYYTNFLSIDELLALPAATVTHLLNPSPPKALGAVAAILAIAGLATILRYPLGWETRGTIGNPSNRGFRSPVAFLGFFSFTMFFYLFLTLSHSRPLWDALPLLAFVQFPWRMLGIATLCAAVLTGAASRWFDRFRNPWVGTAMIAMLTLLGQLSWWYPRYCADFREETLATMLEYEYNTSTVGTSAKGEFLPQTARSIPEDNTLSKALQRGDNPDRLLGVPSTATVKIIDSNPLDFRATVNTPEDFRARYQMFYYLGWRVTINGDPQTIRVTPRSGLIEFVVPAGNSDVRVFFGTTPLRVLASSLSIIALLGLILLITRPRYSNYRPPRQASHAPALLLALPIGLLAVKLLLIDRTDNIFHRTRLNVETLGTPLHIPLDNGLETLAYSVRPNPVPSGNNFEVLLYLTPHRTPEHDFRPLFRLQSPDGQIWNLNPHETLPPRWHREPPRTQYWPIGKYGQFARLYKVLPGTPPGDYHLTATFFDYSTLETSKVLAPQGVPHTDRIDLGTVTVIRPSKATSLASLDVKTETRALLTPAITLVGGSADRIQASPGDLMTVTLFFYAESSPKVNEKITLGLDGTDFALTLEPTPGFPTRQWQAGDVWRGQHLVSLPANLKDGRYIWTVQSSEDQVAHLGVLDIDSPKRIFDQPAVSNSTHLSFGTDILLTGYKWDQQQAHRGDMIEIVLLWKAIQTPGEDISVFVHLENSEGDLVAQHDGVPANWTRPSSGWLPGEYVSDSHIITVPSDASLGQYLLYIGLVERSSGNRLPVHGGAEGEADKDRALLTLLTLIP